MTASAGQPRSEITLLLRRLAAGDRSAENELLPQIYGELKRLAMAQLRRERAGHTLQATELVHEAYLRLANQSQIDWQDRIHFFAMAAKAMRRILVDYARRRNAGKRGGAAVRVPLDDHIRISNDQCNLIAGLDGALDRLAQADARKARIVELRFFGGMTEEQIATLLGISSRTVKRDWVTARAWLYGELAK
jgi:RNA polymerase sigma-70 factor (ECF subfamily)